MYGRGNYAPQFRHGHLIPPPPFQQGPPAPPPPVIQQGSLAAPNHAIQPGPNPPVYHHVPPPPPPAIPQGGPPPPLVQQGQPIQAPNPGVVNAGQPFVHPPTSVHGNSQVISPYSNVLQTSHYPLTVTTQNMHHMSPALHPPAPPLAGPSHPEMIRAPVPPRILPPLPSQGQILYRTSLYPSLAGGFQGHQHVGPLPPPPPSCFVPVTPAPFSSFAHAPVEDAYPPSMPPPPPRSPPSPPPIPSSPPPSPPKPSELSSNLALDAVSAISHHSVLVSDNPTTSVEKLIDDVDRLLVPAQSREDVPLHVDVRNIEGRRAEMESLGEDGFSSEGEATLDLPPSPPPPDPPAEEVVRKIRVLCQFIAKIGPEFEDIACKKESGNPEFAFLFGGEAGSEAAIAHDYFQWMKRKSLLGSKQCNVPGQSNSSPKTWEIISSPKPCNLTDEGATSPANSDMDMEDDANQSSKDQEVGFSVEEQDNSTFGMPSTKDHSAGIHFDGAVECNVNLSVKKVTSPVLDSLSPLKASSDAGGISHKEVSSPFIQGGSPFRLIQDYASDDSLEDDGTSLENVSPVKVSACTADGATSFCKDTGTGLDVNVDSRMTEKEVTLFNDSSVIDPINMPDISLESHKVGEVTVLTSDALDLRTKADELGTNNDGNQTSNDPAASLEVSEQKGSLHSDIVSIDHQNKLRKEDAKQDHTPLKVDEFGRMVREGASDSDSDGPRYSARRGKRGRSRSRSPQDWRRKRSRSPWRRKERRSRSRSWSPKKRRSRSRSPAAFRRKGEFGIDKTKRERGRMPDCVNFLRGRCNRGASCWFLHDDSSMHDGSRHYKTDSRKPAVSGEIKKVTTKMYDFEEAKSQDMPLSITEAPKEETLDGTMDPLCPRGDVQLLNSNEAGQSTVSLPGEVGQIESSQEAIIQVQEKVNGEPIIQPPDFENLQQPTENISALPLDRSPKQSPTDIEEQNLPGEASHGQPLSEEYSVVQLPMPNASATLALPMLENAGHHSQQMDSSSVSCPLPLQTSTTLPGQPPVCDPYPTLPSMSEPSSQSLAPQSLTSEEFHPPSYPSVDYRIQPSYLPPPPPPPPFPRGINASHVSQPPKDYNFSSHSTPLERFPPPPVPLQDHHSLFLGQNPSWTSFQASSSYGSLPAQFPQNTMHSRNDIPHAITRPFQPEEHAHSQVDFHTRPFPPMEQPHPPLQLEDFRLEPPPANKIKDQHFGGPNFVREEHFTHSALPGRSLFQPSLHQDYYLHPQTQLRNEQRFPLPVRDDVQNFEAPPNQRFTSQFQLQGFATSDNMPSQPVSFPRDSPSKQVQSFSKEDFGAISTRQPPYGLQPSGADVFSSHFGAPVKVDSSRYTSSLLESNKLALLSDLGGSKILNTTHYNPFASTFEQPPGGSKFSSSFFRRELDTNYSSNYETSFGPSHVRVDGQGVLGLGSRQTASPLDSGRPRGQILPKSGNSLLAADHAHPRDAPVESFPGTLSQYVRESMAVDQYDPLFDSIEPSSNTLMKFDRVQERDLDSDVSRPVAAIVAGGSDLLSRLTGSHKPLDIAENNKQKEAADAAVTKSAENDEFGETAEVDAVESGSPQPGDGKNWSPGSQNVATGDVEIDQVRSPGKSGKSKKSKDSRSMKLFKSAIADFVKEVLKPSWRQGNMSKEAFKTIVKKTVDKVSGAMKSHQIPKSQAKINQYVESSQRKLTKLVMGYVDKYVKL
ncbi:uncharacterized protein LOC122654087 isoform X2 [Telopea speciosissima]|uniref:uncharacterized protein LOC122654087 isoform X2 n=1 Tax=Telopea speciosissima TaxID=54955 RepID=UPI001CC55AB2|nr:uncharacterized protein LOC122654087 isoform X2 [Telopea speciosissima]